MGKGDRRASARAKAREAKRRQARALRLAQVPAPPPPPPPRPETPEPPRQVLDGHAGAALAAAEAAGLHDAVETRDLWRAWCAFQEARLTVVRLRIGKSLFGACLSIATLAERVEAAPNDASRDLRSHEERVAAAREAWDWWTQLLRRLPPADQDSLREQVADTRELVRDGRLTRAGAGFLLALRRLEREARG